MVQCVNQPPREQMSAQHQALLANSEVAPAATGSTPLSSPPHDQATVQPEYDPHTCVIDCEKTCEGTTRACARDAANNVACTIYPVQHMCGRLTAGAVAPAGSTWQAVFTLESISEIVFTRLANELEQLGAPEDLIERAQRASIEEARHARLATLFAPPGTHFETPTLHDVGMRSLLEIALENAREGCVRETWGAYDAASERNNPTTSFEAFSRAVADDERGHAAWSWALDTWARGTLNAADIATLDEAHEAAITALARDLPATRKSEARLLFALLHAHPSSTFAS